MFSKENIKLPPIKEDNDTNAENRRLGNITTSSKKHKSFKTVGNIVGKNCKWMKDANEEIQDDQLKKITANDGRPTFNVSGKLYTVHYYSHLLIFTLMLLSTAILLNMAEKTFFRYKNDY